MKQVTRNIDPALAHDLLRRVPRACIAFATEAGVQAQPVSLDWDGHQYLIDMPQSVALELTSGQEIVLLVDEGIYYFDLRAIYIRGILQPAQPRPNIASDWTQHELIPSKVVAWDYGMMREDNHDG